MDDSDSPMVECSANPCTGPPGSPDNPIIVSNWDPASVTISWPRKPALGTAISVQQAFARQRCPDSGIEFLYVLGVEYPPSDAKDRDDSGFMNHVWVYGKDIGPDVPTDREKSMFCDWLPLHWIPDDIVDEWWKTRDFFAAAGAALDLNMAVDATWTGEKVAACEERGVTEEGLAAGMQGLDIVE